MSQELSLSVASLRAAYPNQNLPVETVAVYAAALEDLEPADVRDATAALIKASRFFPTVAEIRERVAETRLSLPGPTAAWLEATGRADGTFEGVRHPLVTEALNGIGGVWAVKTTENPVATRSQFLKFFNELRDARIGAFVQTGTLALEAA